MNTGGESRNAAITAVPLGPNESAGQRVAQARSRIEALEFDQAIALLLPLHTLPNIPHPLAVEAGLIETAAYAAQNQTAQAVEACKWAVAADNYNPDVAREQGPRVQTACRTAAAQARRELVTERGLRLGAVNITTAPVAWNPIRVQVAFDGNLTGLTTQAEVAIGTGAPVTVNLPPSGQSSRFVILDANLATPGARVVVMPLVRDAYGVLVRAENASTSVLPRDEAAVQFSAGSDQGPLRVDGQLSGASVRPDSMLPLPPGRHTLEVRSSEGVTSRADINLHRGEVALLTLHGTKGSTLLDVTRWSATIGAVLVLAAGGTLQVFAAANASQLESASQNRDPVTNLPLVPWSNVANLEDNRALFQTAAIGCFIGGGVLAGLAIGLWAVPRGGSESGPSPNRRTANVRFAPTLGGFGLQF